MHEGRFIKTKEQLSVLAIVNFCEDPCAIAEQALDTGAEVRSPLRLQIPITQKTEDLCKVRKLEVTSGRGAHLPFIVDGP